jgi:hypothetical protein
MSDAIERGIYLAADSPRAFVPLALENGDGDKKLLGETAAGILSDDEVDALIRQLIEYRTAEGGEMRD